MLNNKTLSELKIMGVDDTTIVAINDVDLPKEIIVENKNNKKILKCPSCQDKINERNYLFLIKKRCPNCKQKLM